MQFADERQGDGLHRDTEVDDDDCRQDLPKELGRGVQVEAVVERADESDDGGAQQHALPEMVLLVVARGQPDQTGDERPGEDGEAAEQRRGTVGEAPLARFVDRADGPREAHRQRRQ
jgi:hypothetical protein